jgi:hypothetical protein
MTRNPAATPSSYRPPYAKRRSRSTHLGLRWGALFSIVLSLSACLPAKAQEVPEVPRIEVFAGYSYMRFNGQPLGFADTSNLNGYIGAISGNLTRDLGGIAEITGNYSPHVNVRAVLLGPQYIHPRGKFTYSAHILFGEARSFDSVGTGAGSTGSAVAAGGGIDWVFRRHFDVRIVQADYLHTRLFQLSENNLQFSTGIVYRWGRIKWRPEKPPSAPKP